MRRRGLNLGVAGLAAILALLATGSSALAAKTVVNTLGAEAGAKGGSFNTPRGVAVNRSGAGKVAAGTFYVADSGNHRIQQFGPGAGFVRAWGWGVRDGEAEFETCGKAEVCRAGKSGSGAGQLASPQGIAVDQATGAVYVSSQSNRRIDVFTAAGVFAGAFGWGVIDGVQALQFCTAAGGCRAGTTGSGAGQFGAAIGGLFVGPVDGNLYVANKTGRRVDVFAPKLTAGVVTGVGFVRAFGFNVVKEGPDNKVGTVYEVCNVAANPTDVCQQGAGGNGSGQFGATNSPADLALDGAGNVYAVDFANNRIEKFDAASAVVSSTFGAAALSAAFATGQLQSISATPDDHLFVAGSRSASGNQVAVAELDNEGNSLQTHGTDLTVTASNGLGAAPASVGGNLYLASAVEGSRVFVLNEAPTMKPVTSFSGTTAQFEGEVVSGGFPTTYRFEYSVDGQSWTAVPAPDAEALTTAVGEEATGLTGSQQYRVRLVQNRPTAGGPATSAETLFTTAPAAPAIRGTVASLVSSQGASLNAKLDPQNQSTGFHFEYGPSDCSASACTSLPAAESSGGGLRPVTQSVGGLEPETLYHFRLVATNATGTTAGPDRTFFTLSPGADLPDGRRYELVSPADTGGVVPSAAGLGEAEGRDCFITSTASSDGESVIFQGLGGAFPGVNGNGTFDTYRATRTPSGWSTGLASPSGAESEFPSAGGCASDDHAYLTFRTGASPADIGSLVLGGNPSSYLIAPGGAPSLAGQGELGVDQDANVRWIGPGGQHVIFTSEMQLEPEAPEFSGPGEEAVSNLRATAVYDRTPGGATTVVSLLPDGTAPDPSTETTFYQGASADGSAVAFKVEEGLGGPATIYLRRGTETTPVASGPSVGSTAFAGMAGDGSRVFYVEPDLPGIGSLRGRGRLYAVEIASETSVPLTSAGEAFFVNVSADGSHAYFVSPEVLGGGAELGAANLYVWDGSSTAFVAVLDPQDVSGDVSLAHWTEAVAGAEQTPFLGFGTVPARTTPDGEFIVFESRAPLTGYDNEGHLEIFRYAASDGSIVCVSCNPADEPAQLDSKLRALEAGTQVRAPARIPNVTDDGEMVFFETREALLPDDVNEAADVYEWREGRGISLVSAGTGSRSFLYGMSPDGRDVFFTTKDALVPEDAGAIDSIYDARVGGGFAPAAGPPPPCPPDACQGAASVPPRLATPATTLPRAAARRRTRCPKGRQRVRRRGSVRCVKRRRGARGRPARRARGYSFDRGGAR